MLFYVRTNLNAILSRYMQYIYRLGNEMSKGVIKFQHVNVIKHY